MTETNHENIIIRYCEGADEALTGADCRAEAEALAAKLEVLAPQYHYSIRPEGVGTTASATYTGELLKRSDLNPEMGTWYVADATPEGSNLPPG